MRSAGLRGGRIHEEGRLHVIRGDPRHGEVVELRAGDAHTRPRP
ncbi:hypothetical protein [Streptomyces sp. NPDC058632]